MSIICQKRSEKVAEIIFNQPRKRNAISFSTINQLSTCLSQLKEDHSVCVLILRGEGEAFCSGGDLKSFHGLKTMEEALTMLQPMSEVLKSIVTFPAITVSFLNGTAVGGGAEIASATDYRMSMKNGVIGFIQGDLHITTGWGGASLLKNRVGATTALTMLASASRYTMEEAHELGFIHSIVNDISDIDKWANMWSSKEVIQAYKSVLLNDLEKKDLFLSMDKEVEACASLWETQQHHEAVSQFLTKRK
ncbi:enoyl-CoA hydratase/isomerase family protein [Evansella sp. AB-P1]|uniref:enoyl-CoA hydratase/isomerase family protein n=1 Tax=Evansella sp. AB-P1 TaxID=3037653 RepID=UPI0024200CC0|nr:enoyl-CoA hydratase/isomerase family protein [Evansella sp. AB-P1]MDG5788303.1 enoyl-CoA hydratase/isomerase family protein [Evansella sp. AB-P1]